MPISPLVIQQRLTEVGRIRMGERVPSKNGTRPKRLDHFRMTSQRRDVVDAAAAVYGGTVRPWASDAGAQWQVEIETDALDVMVAPGESFSQWFELWKGGGCERRCNGITVETLSGRDVRDQEAECLCPRDPAERVELAAEGAACKPTTRLSVWLPKLRGIGVWRAETHGFYAASELPAAVSLLQGLYEQGYRLTASLRIGTRTIKRPNQPTKTFPVLELDVPGITLSGVLAAGAALPGEAHRIEQVGSGGTRQLAAGNGFSEPPTGHVPSSREKAPRPGNGTPVDLPPGSDMRKPSAAMPASRVEPEHAAFMPFDVDEIDAAMDSETRAASPSETPQERAAVESGASAHPAGDRPEAASGAAAGGESAVGLSTDQVADLLNEAGIPTERAKAVRAELFPGVTRLNDAQRMVLWKRLVADQAGTVVA